MQKEAEVWAKGQITEAIVRLANESGRHPKGTLRLNERLWVKPLVQISAPPLTNFVILGTLSALSVCFLTHKPEIIAPTPKGNWETESASKVLSTMLPGYNVLDVWETVLLIQLWGAMREILAVKWQDQVCPGKDHSRDSV